METSQDIGEALGGRIRARYGATVLIGSSLLRAERDVGEFQVQLRAMEFVQGVYVGPERNEFENATVVACRTVRGGRKRWSYSRAELGPDEIQGQSSRMFLPVSVAYMGKRLC